MFITRVEQIFIVNAGLYLHFENTVPLSSSAILPYCINKNIKEVD
jgi:hypothetical protein